MGLSLLIGTCGGIIYLMGDANASANGLLLVMVNAVCVALTCISEKFVTAKKQQSPLGLCLLRNALSVPFIALFLLADPAATVRASREILQADSTTWFSMMATSVIGAVSGTLLFTLQTKVTATTTQVAALCYKLISTLLSLLLFPTSRDDVGFIAFLGYSLSMLSIGLYTFCKTKIKG